MRPALNFLLFGCILNKSRVFMLSGYNNQVIFMTGDLFFLGNTTFEAVMVY